VADLVARGCIESGRTVVVADVDDVAYARGTSSRRAELWLAAHQAHGALVGQWMRSNVDVVIALGPIYDEEEQQALYGNLPPDVSLCRVLIDAPLATTWARVTADASRVDSRERVFHESAHRRCRALMPGIPADLTFDSSTTDALAIAQAILRTVGMTNSNTPPQNG
jgi:hypothetical protein